MTIGLVGRKCGMTRVFTEDGESIPVTVIEALPNRITQVKTAEPDGYRAVQVTTGSRKASRVAKPQPGHFAKAAVEPGRGLWEFRLAGDEGTDLAPGAEITVDMFSDGQNVDVIGTSIGKGFAGAIKRHNFRTPGRDPRQLAVASRARLDRPEPDPGSRVQGQAHGRPHGQRAPHRAEPERRPGRYRARNLLLVSGAVPGCQGRRRDRAARGQGGRG